MSSRTRTKTRVEESIPDLHFEDSFDLESLSEEELEDFLFDEEPAPSKGIFNLPTIAGMSIIMVGIAYMFQQLGLWSGLDLSALTAMLPWVAGVLIILLGFGVLSWRPKRKKKRVKKAIEVPTGKPKVVVEPAPVSTAGKKLRKSRNKKMAGVCAGLGEYFNVDPTLVRIAFVIGTIASGGPFFLAYLILAIVMPDADKRSLEERITIIRDS